MSALDKLRGLGDTWIGDEPGTRFQANALLAEVEAYASERRKLRVEQVTTLLAGIVQLQAERDALKEQLARAPDMSDDEDTKCSVCGRPVLYGTRHHRCGAAVMKLEADNAALRAFAQDVMESWPEGDVDGGDLQDAAEKHGLLKPETRYEPCCEDCSCIGIYGEYGEYGDAEWRDGVTCYRKTPLLTGEKA